MAKTKDSVNPGSTQPQAGTVISPGAPEGQITPVVEPQAAGPQPEPAPPTDAAEPAPTAATETVPAEPAAPVLTDEPEAARFDDNDQGITWTASEFVAHDKSSGWYALLAAGTVILAAITFLIMRDPVSVGVIVVAGLLFGVYAGHQPRQQEYTLNSRGLGIGQKHYSYGEFKWFSVTQEGAFSSIVLMPLKRFAPLTTVYYPPEDEDEVLAILSQYLPMEEHAPDAVDSLMRRIRF